MRIPLVAALGALVMGASPHQTPAPTRDAGLAAGIEQVAQGDFENAVVTLDLAARALVADSGRRADLAQAYVYMGVAYAGLGQESLAGLKFQQALRVVPDLKLSAGDFSAKVLRLFEQARQASIEEATLGKAAKRKTGKGGLLLLGGGGLVAAGTALAITSGTKERANRPPTATIRVSPAGALLSAATRVTFTAEATDADGDALSYAWTLGDGTVADGPSVSHVYTGDATRTVNLTVRDGLASVTAQATVTVRTITGTWRVVPPTYNNVAELRLTQSSGGQLSLEAILAGGAPIGHCSSGRVVEPRNATFFYGDCRGTPATCCPCSFTVTGQLDESLNTFTGVIDCGGSDPRAANFENCRSCAGRQQGITLAR